MQGCVASARPRTHEECHPQAEQPKVLSAVEDRIDELGAGIAQSRRTVALIKVIPHPHPAPTPAAGSWRVLVQLTARKPCSGHCPAPLRGASPLIWQLGLVPLSRERAGWRRGVWEG